MPEELTLTTERVDDVPLLLAQMQYMELPNLIDSHFRVDGHWRGLSPGWVITIWLAHILSQANHRLSHVQPWAERLLYSLQHLAAQAVRPLDFADDRLAYLLRQLADDWRWANFEATLNRHLLRVYDLPAQRVRIDTTTVSGYWQPQEDNPLFSFGHSKDHRPDLPQLKVLLATLDPLSLPLVTDVVAGKCADDPLYCPAIERVRRSVGRRGLLYIGDSKMAALATRHFVAQGGDYYLVPLPQNALPDDWRTGYLASVADGSQPLQVVQRSRADGALVEIAAGYEFTLLVGEGLAEQQPSASWAERRLVVRSLAGATAAEKKLRERLAVAEAALLELNVRGRGKQRPSERTALDEALTDIMARYQVGELLSLQVQEQWHERTIRGYKGQPGRVERRWDFSVTSTRDEQALAKVIAGLGWRVYATNAPAAELDLAAAVLAYRDEYLIEQGFGRLKGAPLSVGPSYLQRADHAQGLVRLLSLGLRVLSLVEFVARRELAAQDEVISGLYKGQPRASTARPTAEKLLEQFEGVTLTIIEQAGARHYHLTPLSTLQERILTLLGFGSAIYTNLVTESRESP